MIASRPEISAAPAAPTEREQRLIDETTAVAMLQRGRTRMVQAVLNDNGLANAQAMYNHWQGFANCAASMLTNAAKVMALHDQTSDLDGVTQAALARLPNDCERLSFSYMKRLVRSESVDIAPDAVTHSNVDAVVQLQDGVGAAIELDDKHAVAGVDVQDGCEVHGGLPIADAIVAHTTPTEREQRLIDALTTIVRETMDYPPIAPVSSDSYLPSPMIEFAMIALAGCGIAIPMGVQVPA